MTVYNSERNTVQKVLTDSRNKTGKLSVLLLLLLQLFTVILPDTEQSQSTED